MNAAEIRSLAEELSLKPTKKLGQNFVIDGNTCRKIVKLANVEKSRYETSSVQAPGFYGLNTQDSPLTLEAGYAAIATNCVIDQYGRIGARKGWSRVNSSSGNLGANDVKVIHELVQLDGTLTVLFAGNNKLFKLDGSNAVVELTYGGGGTAPTITASNWQCASLNGITYFFQSGYDPLIYDPAVSTTTYGRIS